MAVKVGKAAGAGGGLDAFHHFAAPALFFHLFHDEPVHEDLDGIIFHGEGGFINGIDAVGVGFFHRLGLLGDLQQGFEILLGRGNGDEFGDQAAVGEVGDDLIGVGMFFVVLFFRKRVKPCRFSLSHQR